MPQQDNAFRGGKSDLQQDCQRCQHRRGHCAIGAVRFHRFGRSPSVPTCHSSSALFSYQKGKPVQILLGSHAR